jgi:hypothetical protein
MTIKAEVPGAGDLCGYSTFDFDEFGDDSFEGKTMGEARGSVAASVAELQHVEAATRMHPKPKAYYGKMEKSFFSFKASHPSWISTKSGQTLLDRVEQFKERETRTLALEQKQHLEAAVRQLDTLARLQQRSYSEHPLMGVLSESYISGQPPQTSGADSGGGAASPIVTNIDPSPPLPVVSERTQSSSPANTSSSPSETNPADNPASFFLTGFSGWNITCTKIYHSLPIDDSSRQRIALHRYGSLDRIATNAKPLDTRS